MSEDTHLVITKDEITNFLSSPDRHVWSQGFRDGQIAEIRMLVKRLRVAIEEARKEETPGWQDRIVAYELVIKGRLEDLDYLERTL